MIKLICSNCSSAWYTSNTKSNQKCSDCGSILIEDALFGSVAEKNNDNIKITYSSNIIELKDYLGTSSI